MVNDSFFRIYLIFDPISGSQYRSAIFFYDDEQFEVAKSETEKARLNYGGHISTTLEKATVFYPAEQYHQDYLTVNPHGYECSTHFERSWEQIIKMHKK